MDAFGNYSLLSQQAYLASREAEAIHLDCVYHNQYAARKPNLTCTEGRIWPRFSISKALMQ